MLGKLLNSVVVVTLLGAMLLAGMIAFGGPVTPPVNSGLSKRDAEIGTRLSDQPAQESFKARDGAALSFRRYPGAAGGGVVVLVHGSSGSNAATHSLAKSMSLAGMTVLAIDVRGHGGSGPHGDIAYASQLDDDMSDLATMISQRFPKERRLLAGHSSGGGFVLHIAGGARSCAFEGYLSLSPYLNYQSPANRPDAGWASPGVPRMIALAILNRIGITAFDNLPVVAFAIAADAANRTPTYSWRLQRGFGLDMVRWEDEIKSIDHPTRVMIGAADELFVGSMYPGVFAALQPHIGVSVLPGVDHMGMILDEGAIAQATSAARAMLNEATQTPCLAD
ncbi:MAG: alpha/beta fold hydrolase [Micropepsaceae bacterium]